MGVGHFFIEDSIEIINIIDYFKPDSLVLEVCDKKMEQFYENYDFEYRNKIFNNLIKKRSWLKC